MQMDWKIKGENVERLKSQICITRFNIMKIVELWNGRSQFSGSGRLNGGGGKKPKLGQC